MAFTAVMMQGKLHPRTRQEDLQGE